LLWAVGYFAVAQAGLLWALTASSSLRDPEYGHRLSALRQRLAERAPGRPLVVLLGSSRVALGVRPGLLATNERTGGRPIVFNFGLCRAGPLLELLCLRRLLDDGIRPAVVLAELWPVVLPWASGEEQAVSATRLSWTDEQRLAPYLARPGALRRDWLQRHAVPWHGERRHLLARWAPALEGCAPEQNAEWEGLDGWGWLRHPRYAGNPREAPAARRRRVAETARVLLDTLRDFAVSEMSCRALGEMAEVCARHHIRLAFLLMPGPVAEDSPPDVTGKIEEGCSELSRRLNVSVVDGRGWASRDDFEECVHLSHRGAAQFTRRFGRELGPYFAGRSFAARWPPGRSPAAGLQTAERPAGR
jgi:hypothetical protein